MLCFSLWWQHGLRLWEQRKAELLEVAHKAEPLIAALEAYHKDHQRYPDRLAQLVPDYLLHIPEPTHPKVWGWGYASGQKINPWCRAVNPRYELGAGVYYDLCPFCDPAGQVFVYHPTGVYLEDMHGAGLEKVGKWAYYHDTHRWPLIKWTR